MKLYLRPFLIKDSDSETEANGGFYL